MNRILNCFLRTLLLTLMVLHSFQGRAQAPISVPYQAVARDAAGNPIDNQTISLRFSIRTGSATGTIVYQETQVAVTNLLGLFDSEIGQGTPVIGTLAGVNWGNGLKFLQVEMDTAGGSSYISMGTTQLNSVPYALFSARSGNFNDGSAAGNTPYWNGTTWVTSNSNIYNNGGNVGVGTTTPATKLDVAGDTKVNGVIRTSKTAPIGQHGSSMWIGGNDNGSLFTPGTPEIGIRIFNNSISPGQSTIQGWDYLNNQARDIVINDAGGKLGIGTASPVAKVDINGNIKIADGTQGAGKVLTSDASGLATWTTPMLLPTGTSTGNTVRWNGTAWVADSLLTNTGARIGIGTTSPQDKLHIKTGGIVLDDSYQRFFKTGVPQWDVFGDSLGYAISRSGIDFPFYISRTTGNLGLGSTTPGAKLDVVGTVKITDGTQGAGKVLTSDANGLATWTTPMLLPIGTSTGNTVRWNGTAWVADSLLTNTGARIGIGTTSPQDKLHIKTGGIVLDDSYQRFFKTGVPQWDVFGDSLGYAISRSGIDFPFYISRTTGNLGLGSTTPGAKLDVVGTVKITDGTQGAGKVLTSDANGLATWTTPMLLPIGTSTGNTVRWNGTAWVADSLLTNTGARIGIGTTTPQDKLHIKTGGIVLDDSYQRFFKTGVPQWDVFGDSLGYAISRSGIDFPFYISRTTGNLGLGSTTPGAKLDVVGTVKITDGTQGAGKVLTSDANGLATWTTPTGLPAGAAAGNTPYWNGTSWVTNNSNVFNNGGNVGIGTTTPGTKLEVAGASNLNGDTKVDGVIRTSKTAPIGQHGSSMWIGGNDNGNLFTPGTPEIGIRIFNNAISPGQSTIQGWDYFNNQARDIVMNDAGGKLGIGTASPVAKVDINGNIKIADGTQGAGKVLTSDASGLATWTTPMQLPTGTSNGNTVRWNGTAWTADSLLTNTGTRIGIGTTSPQDKLHVKTGAIILDDAYQRYFTSGVARWDIFGDNAGFAISRSGIDFPFYISRTTGNVGLGSTTPGAKLEVVGTVKITDGTQGAGKVLTSDANGLATWTTPMQLPSGTSNGNTLRWNGSAWAADNLLTNTGTGVGIGTTSPQDKLHIKTGGMILDDSYQRFFVSGAPKWDIIGDNTGYGISRSGIDFPFFILRSNGNLGVGTQTPAYTFDVTTSKSGSFAARIYNSGNTTTSTALLVRGCDANGTNGSLLQTFQSGNGTTYGSISFTSTGISYNTTSDMRLKKNITDSKTGINVLNKIQIKDYQYINRGEEVVQGFLAQQLYEVYPQAVTKGTDEKDENGRLVNPWMVDYSKLTPLLIKSVQDQQAQIEELKAENAKLSQQMDAVLKAMQKN